MYRAKTARTSSSSAGGAPSAPSVPPAALLWALLLTAAGLYLALLYKAPPKALPSTASASLFSAERAWPLLERLVGDETPHPTGMAKIVEVRQRVIDEFAAVGYEVELQSEWSCSSRYEHCAQVNNLIARLPGLGGGGKALMITAHYDSVPEGPGVSDDMAAVAAIIEVAGILASEAPMRNDVLFVITDGEEQGLLGAEAFLSHPAWQEVGLVANFEARGTRGQSFLFQTSRDNAWLIERYAAAAPRAATSSLYYDIYDRMRNDTDLTVYLEAGMPGINFAFIEGVQNYHTPQDDLAHLSVDTFQHHGENVLATARAFGDADLTVRPTGNALYQDVLPGVVLQAPEGWAPWLALGSLALWLLIALALVAAGTVRLGGLVTALVLTLVGLVAAAALGYGVSELHHLVTGVSVPWPEQPLPIRVAIWAVGAFGYALFAALAADRTGFWGLTTATWLLWSVLATATAFLAPAASVVLLLPTLAATAVYAVLTLFGAGLGGRRRGVIPGWVAFFALVTVVTTSYLVLPLPYLVEQALGLGVAPALSLLVALGISAATPFLAVPRGARAVRFAVLALTLATAAGATVWAINLVTA